jgi:F-type H+-transporting ATPase subunit gamma
MATMREIRTRIKTVKNIEKITRAMKLVAAARLKRAQGRAEAARPYADKLQEMMRNLAPAASQIAHPLLEVREERNIAVIVMTSDRGLCGSYNANILRRAMELLRPRDPETVRLVLLGRKGIGFFRRHRYPVVTSSGLNATDVSFDDVRPVADSVRQMFESGEVDAVYIIYARFLSPMTQQATVLPLLPLKPPSAEGETEEVAPGGEEIMFEPEAEQILARLLPRYVDTQIYRALVEAVASEHGARMTSMSAATTNAGEMIDTLTLSLNRARQAAITKEIAEIVGGAEALK